MISLPPKTGSWRVISESGSGKTTLITRAIEQRSLELAKIEESLALGEVPSLGSASPIANLRTGSVLYPEFIPSTASTVGSFLELGGYIYRELSEQRSFTCPLCSDLIYIFEDLERALSTIERQIPSTELSLSTNNSASRNKIEALGLNIDDRGECKIDTIEHSPDIPNLASRLALFWHYKDLALHFRSKNVTVAAIAKGGACISCGYLTAKLRKSQLNLEALPEDQDLLKRSCWELSLRELCSGDLLNWKRSIPEIALCNKLQLAHLPILRKLADLSRTELARLRIVKAICAKPKLLVVDSLLSGMTGEALATSVALLNEYSDVFLLNSEELDLSSSRPSFSYKIEVINGDNSSGKSTQLKNLAQELGVRSFLNDSLSPSPRSLDVFVYEELGLGESLARFLETSLGARMNGISARSFNRRAKSKVSSFERIPLYHGLTWEDIQQLKLSEVLENFKAVKGLTKVIAKAIELGLGNIRFGAKLGALSSGEYRRVQILSLLISKETALLLDEPFLFLSKRQSEAVASVLEKEERRVVIAFSN